ncbi:FAD/NAD(P)-binding domain-containing protein [Gautieria morchelliformis]|nr:FAD/NAD(P)-binding domain-containing protein [Gautieria morchelliformis]
MQNGHSKDFNVAIVGGGMGGLALAVVLTRGGIKVDIFEQAPKFDEIGAGVGIGANGVRALRGLGILDTVLEKTGEPLEKRGFLFMSGLPGHEMIYDYPVLDTDVAMGVHRARFLDALVNLVPADIAHFDKKCNSLSQSESNGVTITFKDGTTHTADIVIGCDGVRSAVRASVVGSPADSKFTRTVAFRGLISEADGVAALGGPVHRPMAYLGPDRHVIVFPLKGKQIINIVVFATDRSRSTEGTVAGPGDTWVVPSSQAEMLGHFVGWGPKVLNLLQHLKNPSKWLLHSVSPPLDSYVREKVALLGDAAHSMLPHLGAGAGQAMEDALLLGKLLTHPSTSLSNVGPVLQAYDSVRRPRANGVLTGSYVAGEIYEYAGPSGPSLEGLRKDLTGIFDSVWHRDLDEDCRTAVKFLIDRQVFDSV